MHSLYYYEELINKYKSNGIIIDSNLLIYFFIGEFEIDIINQFKLTHLHGKDGYLIIKEIINRFNKIYTSAQIMTEVYNLSNKLPNKLKYQYFDTFFSKLTIFEESLFHSIDLMEDKRIRKFGFADSSIYKLAQQNNLVLTEDLELMVFLESQGLDVINLNNIIYLLN